MAVIAQRRSLEELRQERTSLSEAMPYHRQRAEAERYLAIVDADCETFAGAAKTCADMQQRLTELDEEIGKVEDLAAERSFGDAYNDYVRVLDLEVEIEGKIASAESELANAEKSGQEALARHKHRTRQLRGPQGYDDVIPILSDGLGGGGVHVQGPSAEDRVMIDRFNSALATLQNLKLRQANEVWSQRTRLQAQYPVLSEIVGEKKLSRAK